MREVAGITISRLEGRMLAELRRGFEKSIVTIRTEIDSGGDKQLRISLVRSMAGSAFARRHRTVQDRCAGTDPHVGVASTAQVALRRRQQGSETRSVWIMAGGALPLGRLVNDLCSAARRVIVTFHAECSG